MSSGFLHVCVETWDGTAAVRARMAVIIVKFEALKLAIMDFQIVLFWYLDLEIGMDSPKNRFPVKVRKLLLLFYWTVKILVDIMK